MTENYAVLLATYNGEEYLEEQLDSLLAQTFGNWKLYVHDDGSTDSTLAILDKYQKKHPQKMEILQAPSTGGARNNFFFLLENVDADRYFFCDQDDVWKPDKMEKTIALMEKTEKDSALPALVCTDLEVVDENLQTIAPRMSVYQKLNLEKLDINHLLIHNVVTGCTVLMNRSLRNELLRLQNRDHLIMHDWAGAIIAAYSNQIDVLKEPTICYRQHGDNSVGAADAGSLDYVAEKSRHTDSARKSLEATREQAAEIARSLNWPEDSICFRYGNLASYNKIRRICFYLKNHVLKKGLARNIGLLLLG